MKLFKVLTLLLCSCTVACPSESGDAQKAADVPVQRPTAAPVAPAKKPVLVAEGRQIMGTWWEVKVEQSDQEPKARAAIKRALDEIARLEDVLSEWRPHTEISQINQRAGAKEAVPIGPETFDVLEAGLRVSVLSGGAFDLTWAAMRGLYRFERDVAPTLPDPKLLRQKRALVAYRDVVFDQEARTVRLVRKGMAIGTGGIAKGYALDRAAAILEADGFVNYLMFAGGQVHLHGSREGRAWRVGIKHPRKLDQHVGFFEVHDGSISTSGDYEHAFEVNGKRVHHIIDPTTGYPATKSASVTLIARRGIDADALSTACFVLGPERCLAMLEKAPDAPQAVIIDPSLRVHLSPGLEGKVLFNPPLVDGRLPD